MIDKGHIDNPTFERVKATANWRDTNDGRLSYYCNYTVGNVVMFSSITQLLGYVKKKNDLYEWTIRKGDGFWQNSVSQGVVKTMEEAKLKVEGGWND